MKYAIAETWNGGGYSYLNTAVVVKLTPSKLAAYMRHRAKAVRKGGFRVRCGKRKLTYWHKIDTSREETGTIQALPMRPDTYGCVILCNINTAVLLNSYEYKDMLTDARAQADPDDPDVGTESPFIGAHGGEYDFKFVKLQDNTWK